MKRMRRLSLFAILCALAVPPALTAQVDTGAQRRAAQRERFQEVRKKRLEKRRVVRKARGFRRLKVEGTRVRPATERLARKLDWHDTLASAQRAARRTGKPIVWIHALGDLTGVL